MIDFEWFPSPNVEINVVEITSSVYAQTEAIILFSLSEWW